MGVICLPSQKVFKVIDENTSVLDTFRITGGLLVEGVRGVWQLLTRPGLIQIHFEDLCALVRDRHSESVFAHVEAAGAGRSREVVEKLLVHPLLDEGRALAESDTVLVSLIGGKDLTMADVNRVMEQISHHCEHAQIIMGAAVDAELKNRLSVTVIAAKRNTVAPTETPATSTPADLVETAEFAGRNDEIRRTQRVSAAGAGFGTARTYAGEKCRQPARARAVHGCVRNSCRWRSFPKAASIKASRRFTRAKIWTSPHLSVAAWH